VIVAAKATVIAPAEAVRPVGVEATPLRRRVAGRRPATTVAGVSASAGRDVDRGRDASARYARNDVEKGVTMACTDPLGWDVQWVTGIQPYTNSLNATGANGVTVFRTVETEYDADAAAADLSLDSFPPSVERALADLTPVTPCAGTYRPEPHVLTPQAVTSAPARRR